jgi:hypothetical protein
MDQTPEQSGLSQAAKQPQDPPCDGGVRISWATTTRCVDGVVHYIDTVGWKCPDGSIKTVTSDTPTEPPVPC